MLDEQRMLVDEAIEKEGVEAQIVKAAVALVNEIGQLSYALRDKVRSAIYDEYWLLDYLVLKYGEKQKNDSRDNNA